MHISFVELSFLRNDVMENSKAVAPVMLAVLLFLNLMSFIVIAQQLSSISEEIPTVTLENKPWIACGESFLVGTRQCPRNCPFVALDSMWQCVATCVSAEGCAQANPSLRFADAESSACRPCAIFGCSDCTPESPLLNPKSSSMNRKDGVLLDRSSTYTAEPNFHLKYPVEPAGCRRCLKGFQLSSDGSSCFVFSDEVSFVIIAILVACLVCVLAYLTLFFIKNQPPPNLEVFRLAMRHQSFSKFRDRSKQGNPPYSLCTNLASTNIGGVGIALYFRFLFLLAAIGAVAFVILGVATVLTDIALANLFPTRSLSENEYTKTVFLSPGSASYSSINIPNVDYSDELVRFCLKNYVITEENSFLKKKSLLMSLLSGSTKILEKFEIEASFYSCLIYLAVLILSIYYSYCSQKFIANVEAQHDTMGNFAVIASGIPKDAVNDSEIKQYIEKLLNIEIVGVSILYNYGIDTPEIRRLAEQQIEWADLVKGMLHKGVTYLSLDRRRTSDLKRYKSRFPGYEIVESINKKTAIDIVNRLTGSGKVIIIFNRKKDIQYAIKAFKELQAFVEELEMTECSCNLSICNKQYSRLFDYGRFTQFLCNAKEIELVSTNSRQTGDDCSNKDDTSIFTDPFSISEGSLHKFYASVGNHEPRKHMGSKTVEQLLFRGQHLFKLRQFYVEPIDVLWENFSVTKVERWIRAIWAVIVLVVVLLVCGSVMYVPYAMYSASFAAGSRGPGPFQNMLLGAIIGIGNALVGEVVQSLVNWVRFTRLEFHDTFVFIVSYVSLQMNVIFNVVIAYMSNEKQQPEFMWSYRLLFSHTYNHDFTHSIGREVLFAKTFSGYLIPGVLVFPSIFSVITMYILPQIINSFVVLYTPSNTIRTAERKLECTGCHLPTKYSEILVSFTSCITLLYFISDMKLVALTYLCFGISCLFINYRDTYLFLRMTKQSYHHDTHLGTAVYRTWGFITVLVAANPPYWLWRAGVAPYWTILLAVILHLFIHEFASFLCRLYLARDHCYQDTTYHALAYRCPFNWFNTNAAHVLKKFYELLPMEDELDDDSAILSSDFHSNVSEETSSYCLYDHIVYFQVGKEYLQGRQFAEYVPHGEEAQELLENVKQRIMRSAVNQTQTTEHSNLSEECLYSKF